MAAPAAQPIIIKRIKKGGGGHHGGAWKVAYADFVTAMMAFFLLLWLINVTTPAQKMGLAEYFTPTMGVKDAMGIGFKGGKTPSTVTGRSNTDLSAPGLVEGQIKQGPVPVAPDVSKPVKADPDAESTSNDQKAKQDGQDVESSEDGDQLKVAEQDIKQSLEQDQDLKDFKNNVVVQDTPEGLKIDMIDDEKKPMFIPGGAVLTDGGKKVLDAMANIISKTPNNITINGHTDANAASGNPQYTNWELSADRANAARRFLSTTQLERGRVMKIVALADRELLVPEEPTSPRNRRVTIILMRGSYFRDPKAAPTTRAILSVPDAKVKEEPKQQPAAQPQEKKPAGPSIFDPNR
ncbi:MAG: flagellar motor protein MotB [Pseudomonadota bacterium]|nr:flagellar motor protein MotB [Pseudomonadota bacterium]